MKRLELSVPILVVLAQLTTACTIKERAIDYIRECEPGTQRCDGNAVEQCQSDGESWAIAIECGPTESCQEAQCVITDPIALGDGFVVADAQPSPSDAQLDADSSEGGDADADSGGREDADALPTTPLRVDVRLELTEGLEEGFVDVGFCSSQSAATGDADTHCSGSLYVRFELVAPNTWVAQLFQSDPGVAPMPLWDAPVDLDADEVFNLRFQVVSGGSSGLPAQLQIEFAGILSGTPSIAATTVPASTLSTFGVWNFGSGGDGARAAELRLADLDVSSPKVGLLDLDSLTESGTFEGDALQPSPEGTAVLYFDDATIQSIWLPLTADRR